MRKEALEDGISQEQRVESDLRKGELHFRRLLEKLPAGAYTCDFSASGGGCSKKNENGRQRLGFYGLSPPRSTFLGLGYGSNPSRASIPPSGTGYGGGRVETVPSTL